MNWNAIGAIGTIVGAAGVVATLVYLAYQIRQNAVQLEQNTLAAKAAAQNASNGALRETRKSIFESLQMSETYFNGNQDPGALDEISLMRYRLVIQNVTDVMLEIYTQTMVTGFSPETWQSQGRTLVVRALATPRGQWFWENYSDNHAPAFRAEVERIISENTAKLSDAQ